MRAQNNPLYIKAYGQHDQLRFHFIVHTSLDFLEEKVAAQTQGSASIPTAATSKHDSYLGLLYPIEELRVYGYLTNCRIKLLAVLDDDEVKDAEMKALFRRLHALYVDTTSNPFHSPETELMSIQSFDRQVQRIVSAGLYELLVLAVSVLAQPSMYKRGFSRLSASAPRSRPPLHRRTPHDHEARRHRTIA